MSRTILHADMDAFYASVEQRDDPSLRGRPVVVGGPSRRGVVGGGAAEARRFGIHSAMPMAQALQRCADLVVIQPRGQHYAGVSGQVFEILERYSPLVEPLSLDEAFLDISGTERLHGDARQVALAIKRAVREQLDLVVSIGVAPSKFVAKVASDLGKPDGLILVPPGEVEAFLWPLPVSRVFGVGKVTLQALEQMGVRTIGELAAHPPGLLRQRFGEHGEQLSALARGIDEREVVPDQEAKSLGHEDTFHDDIGDLEELTHIVLEQADRVGRRLRRHDLRAATVMLKAKTAGFRLLTRRRRLPRPSSDGETLGRAAVELLAELMTREPGPFRLTGVTACDLADEGGPRQLSLDEPRHERQDRLARTLDAIADRFGEDAVARATTVARRRRDDEESD
jgi:DNA polymerase-4